MADRGGPLIIIGGHEDKEGDREILTAVAEKVRGGRLVIATLASREPEGYFDTYQKVFNALGINDVAELYAEERSDNTNARALDLLGNAAGIFFTGGDQLRISSQIGDTPVEKRILELHAKGAVIAGTSAGASVMSETMVVKGAGGESYRIGELRMAPGLGLLKDAIIDQHFAERGRFGRLAGAVAHNPRLLGLGIDENTALVVEGRQGRVIGEGAVYVVDAEEATRSNIAEARSSEALSIHGLTMHVLSAGDVFNFAAREPGRADDQNRG